VMPVFSLAAVASIALPLFIVTLASQNLPGVAAIRQAGYDTPVSFPVAFSGLLTAVLAPFGAFGLNLAAITAAICMSPEAHPEPEKRYTAVISAAFWYCLVGSFGVIVVSLLVAFPKPLILALAGLALLGTIGNALAQAMAEPAEREAALVTFLVTLSGVTLAGIGAAFWGVVAGAVTLYWLGRPVGQVERK
jgi:benzoate membrane transport protein